MKEPAKEVVVGPCAACIHRQTEKIGKTGHNEHVPKNRSGGNAWGLGPADLKAQLPAEIGQPKKSSARLAHLFQALQIAKTVQPVYK